MLALLTFGILEEGGDTPEEPNGEPVSLELAREYARVAANDSDDAVNQLISAARGYVENYTGLALVRREFVEEQYPTNGGYLELYFGPAVEVDSITYIDTDDTDQVYEDARLRASRRPARIYPVLNNPWPCRSDSGFLVTYEAGFEEGEVPPELVQAMLLLISHWDKNREAVSDKPANEVPLAVKALCDPWRMPVV